MRINDVRQLRYRTLGNGARHQLGVLTNLLARRGGVETSSDDPELWLVGEDSVAGATAALERLDERSRSKAVLIGIEGTLDVRRRVVEGTLGSLLERYRPLGVLTVTDPWDPWQTHFIGPKALAERLDAGFAQQFSSTSYGTWLRCDAEDAGEFVMRVLENAITGR